MLKKIFFACLAMILFVQGAAAAKNKGLPEEERIRVAVEVTDDSRHVELGTAQNLELFLNEKLGDKNLVSVVDINFFGEEKKSDGGLIRDEDLLAENKPSAEDIGELLVFDAFELPKPAAAPENFQQTFYKNLDVAYVIRCEVLALGATKLEDKTVGMLSSIIGGGISLSGSGSSNRDKTLRRVGSGIGLLGLVGMTDITKRTALNTVVNMQFISVETGEILWQQNFTGQAIKHHKPDKNFDNVWTQAYMDSVENAAKLISKRVNKYVDKVIIKGKSDKDFLPKASFGKLIGGKLF